MSTGVVLSSDTATVQPLHRHAVLVAQRYLDAAGSLGLLSGPWGFALDVETAVGSLSGGAVSGAIKGDRAVLWVSMSASRDDVGLAVVELVSTFVLLRTTDPWLSYDDVVGALLTVDAQAVVA